MNLKEIKEWYINRAKWKLGLVRKFWWIMPVIWAIIYFLKH